MIDYNNVSSKVFGILKGHGLAIKLFTIDGSETVDPEEARRFFVKEPNMMITVNDADEDIRLNKHSQVELAQIKSILKQLRNLAGRYMLNFSLKVFGKQIEPRDYAFQAKNYKDKHMNDITEATFSKMGGSTKSSSQQLENVVVRVRHKTTVDENIRGSRSRNISAIFLEQGGERFKYPHTHLAGARAMARHMYNGGTFADTLGEHIIGCSANFNKLKEFMRYTRTNKLVNEDSSDVVELIRENLESIAHDLKKIAGSKTYESIKIKVEENTTETLEEQENDTAQLKELFTVKRFDTKFEDVLPIIGKMVQERKQYHGRIEEAASADIFLTNIIAESSLVEFDSPSKALAYKLQEMSKKIIENVELTKFVSTVATKISEDQSITMFEKNIIRKVLENAKLKNNNLSEMSELKESTKFHAFFNKYDMCDLFESSSSVIVKDKQVTLLKYMSEQLTQLQKQVSLCEDSSASPELAQALQMMDAARKGLSIVGRMPPGEYRAKHTRRIMSNLNRIRGLVSRLQ